MAGEFAIEAKGLKKWFGEGEARTHAVKDFSFNARFGEMLYIVGPSGSGKTTLLSMISGILRPTAGSVTIDGTDIWRLSEDAIAEFRLKRIGFVFQDYHLFPRLSTAENVAIPLILQRHDWNEAMGEALKNLEIVGLGSRAGLMPMKLSGGEQQRVAIARALIGRPEILVLDEPTASLDGETGRTIVSFLRTNILNDQRSIVIVTHDPRILDLATRIASMEDGRLVQIEERTSRVNRAPLYVLSAAGILAGVSSAILYAQEKPPLPPVFNPAANPYAKGIYANGIVESYQSQGENINIYPEIAGPITKIMVAEGDAVQKGTPLLTVDDSVQRSTVEQEQAQAEAALAMLQELRAAPRAETLAVSVAQVANAKAGLKNAQDQLDKEEQSYRLDPQSVAKNDLDNARNSVNLATTNLAVVQKQYDLTNAGAWVYDIMNQEKQYVALSKTYAAGEALLSKYTIQAPIDGVVLAVLAAPGSYVSPQGAYDSYTQAFAPVVVMGTMQQYLEVRAYIDEILVSRLPSIDKMEARMFIHGTDFSVPLTYERTQPYVSPKIELSDQKQERVDVRVLPLIFRFEKPTNVNLYPGELVDVYVGAK